MTSGAALTSPRTYDALGGYMVVSSVADAIPLAFIAKVLDDIGFPEAYRWIFSPIKAAAAATNAAIFAAMTAKGPDARRG